MKKLALVFLILTSIFLTACTDGNSKCKDDDPNNGIDYETIYKNEPVNEYNICLKQGE